MASASLAGRVRFERNGRLIGGERTLIQLGQHGGEWQLVSPGEPPLRIALVDLGVAHTARWRQGVATVCSKDGRLNVLMSKTRPLLLREFLQQMVKMAREAKKLPASRHSARSGSADKRKHKKKRSAADDASAGRSARASAFVRMPDELLALVIDFAGCYVAPLVCTRWRRLRDEQRRVVSFANESVVSQRVIVRILRRNRRLRQLSFAKCDAVTPALLSKLSELRFARLTALDVSGCRRLTDSALRKLLRRMPALCRLRADGCAALTAAAFAHAQQLLPSLQVLQLQRVKPYSTALLSALAALPQLRDVTAHVSCDDERHAAALSALPPAQLSSFCVAAPQWTDEAACASLQPQAASLCRLHISAARLTRLTPLFSCRWPLLAHVCLDDMPTLSTASLSALAHAAPALEHVSLRACIALRGEAVANLLSKCRKLKRCIVDGCGGVADDAIPAAAAICCRLLRLLSLRGCSVSWHAQQRLQAALPDCIITAGEYRR